MVVVLKTESEDMKFFFQGCDELTVLLYQELLVPKLDILRFDLTQVYFKHCTSVKDLVAIGNGAAASKERRQCAQPVPRPHHSEHHTTRLRRDNLFNVGHPERFDLSVSLRNFQGCRPDCSFAPGVR
jgi:hypothetical protein